MLGKAEGYHLTGIGAMLTLLGLRIADLLGPDSFVTAFIGVAGVFFGSAAIASFRDRNLPKD